jgi:radical SAM superfamily enzyme YgiQ (UPF0313 family)
MARVLFIQNFWFEYLGIMLLSSRLKEAGHTVDLLIESKIKPVLEFVDEMKPDVVGAYVVSGSHSWALQTMRAVKNSCSVFTVIGGPHPTFFPDVVQDEGLDAICIGEADDAILELCSKIDGKEDLSTIRNLWIKKGEDVVRNDVRPLFEDLDSLPYPDREIYYKYKILRNSPSKHFITGRGCPFNCAFCCNKAYKDIYKGKGKMVRRAKPEKTCTEIVQVKNNYPLDSVRFDDEVFLLQPDWLMEFLDRYRVEVGLPFSCLIRADLTTEAMIRAMKNSGCYIAYFGIESGNDRIRNEILGKNISKENIRDTAYLLRKYQIKIGTFNMVGMPTETVENAWETVQLNQEIHSDYPWCSIIQPYPGTQLEKHAKQSGHLDKAYGVNDLSQSYFNDTVIQNEDADRLITLQKLFYLAVRFPWLSGLIQHMVNRGKKSILNRWIFNITYAYRYSRTYRMPFWELLRRAILWKDTY